MTTKTKFYRSRSKSKKSLLLLIPILFLGISAVALAGFLTFNKTNFFTNLFSKAAGEDQPGVYPRKSKVLILKYLEAPNAEHEQFLSQRITEWEQQIEDASKYHFYKNSAATPVLDVQIRPQHITRYGVSPIVKNPDGSLNYDGSFKAMVEANNNEICNIINNEGIDQVWYMITPDANIETTGGYNAEWYLSNIYDTDPNKALCGKKRSFMSLTLSTETAREHSLHVLAHYMENLIVFTQTAELFHGRFEGTGYIWNGPPDVYRNDKVCGDVHFTPNASIPDHDYDYYQPRSVEGNTCEDWHPDIAQAQKQTVTSANWKCSAEKCLDVDYYQWWFNNMPGKDNAVYYQGKRILPWFELLADFDKTIEYYASQPGYFLAPYFDDKARPFYITDKSMIAVGSGQMVSWAHDVSGEDRLLVVSVAYHTEHDDGTGPLTSNVNYGTTPMILVRRDLFHGFISEIWYLKNPPLGKKNVVVNFPINNGFGGIVATGTTFVGVDQSNPIRLDSQGLVTGVGAGSIDASNPNKAGHPAITIPGQSGDYIFATLNTYSGDNTATRDGVTAGIWDRKEGDILSKGGVQQAVSNATTLEWKTAKNWQWSISGIAIKPKTVVLPSPSPSLVPTPVPTPSPSVVPTPVPTPLPSVKPTPTPVSNGLTGRYYDNVDFTPKTPTLTRVDPRVVFNWGVSTPDSKVKANTFSIRWTGSIKAPATGAYTFYAVADDGVRLWVNNKRIINSWTNKTKATEVKSSTINLTKGQTYPIRIDYYENTGNASIKLYWSYGKTTKQLVPANALFAK